MKFDPQDGSEKPFPSNTSQYRKYHGDAAFLFNPFSGGRRDARDVGSDLFGHLISDKIENVNCKDIGVLENEIVLLKEDIECPHMWLDDKGVPRKLESSGCEYSIIGRFELYIEGELK